MTNPLGGNESIHDTWDNYTTYQHQSLEHHSNNQNNHEQQAAHPSEVSATSAAVKYQNQINSVCVAGFNPPPSQFSQLSVAAKPRPQGKKSKSHRKKHVPAGPAGVWFQTQQQQQDDVRRKANGDKTNGRSDQEGNEDDDEILCSQANNRSDKQLQQPKHNNLTSSFYSPAWTAVQCTLGFATPECSPWLSSLQRYTLVRPHIPEQFVLVRELGSMQSVWKLPTDRKMLVMVHTIQAVMNDSYLWTVGLTDETGSFIQAWIQPYFVKQEQQRPLPHYLRLGVVWMLSNVTIQLLANTTSRSNSSILHVGSGSSDDEDDGMDDDEDNAIEKNERMLLISETNIEKVWTPLSEKDISNEVYIQWLEQRSAASLMATEAQNQNQCYQNNIGTLFPTTKDSSSVICDEDASCSSSSTEEKEFTDNNFIISERSRDAITSYEKIAVVVDEQTRELLNKNDMCHLEDSAASNVALESLIVRNNEQPTLSVAWATPLPQPKQFPISIPEVSLRPSSTVMNPYSRRPVAMSQMSSMSQSTDVTENKMHQWSATRIERNTQILPTPNLRQQKEEHPSIVSNITHQSPLLTTSNDQSSKTTSSNKRSLGLEHFNTSGNNICATTDSTAAHQYRSPSFKQFLAPLLTKEDVQMSPKRLPTTPKEKQKVRPVTVSNKHDASQKENECPAHNSPIDELCALKKRKGLDKPVAIETQKSAQNNTQSKLWTGEDSMLMAMFDEEEEDDDENDKTNTLNNDLENNNINQSQNRSMTNVTDEFSLQSGDIHSEQELSINNNIINNNVNLVTNTNDNSNNATTASSLLFQASAYGQLNMDDLFSDDDDD